jgi:hypothetical protein
MRRTREPEASTECEVPPCPPFPTARARPPWVGRLAHPGRRCAPAGVRSHPAGVGGAGQDQGCNQVIRRRGRRIRGKSRSTGLLCHQLRAWRAGRAECECRPSRREGVTKWRVASITTKEGKAAGGLTRPARPVRWRRSTGGGCGAVAAGEARQGERETMPRQRAGVGLTGAAPTAASRTLLVSRSWPQRKLGHSPVGRLR